MYVLQKKQVLPISLEKAWDYFSSPSNLKEITPYNLGFKIETQIQGQKDMYPGQIISYTVSPVLGIPVRWVTEITQVESGKFFIDEQRFGPYKMWHHEHHFKPIPGGTEMTDIIHYVIPLGFLGRIANALFVKRQLNDIFDYRFKKVTEIFG